MALSLTARGLLGIVALALILRNGGSLVMALTWMLVARTAVYFLYDSTYALRSIRERRARGTWKQQASAQWAIFKQSLPLGIVLMLNALVISTPRYFIEDQLGARELGFFTAIFSLANAGNLLVNSLGQAATPRLARFYDSGDARGFKMLSIKMSGLGAALGLLGLTGSLVAGSFALRLLYRPEYAQHAWLLTIAMAATAVGFVASALGYAITAARRFREQMPLQVACLAATALSAYLLVPRMGLAGAAVSIGIGSLVQILAEGWIWRGILASMAGERTA